MSVGMNVTLLFFDATRVGTRMVSERAQTITPWTDQGQTDRRIGKN